MNLSNHFKMCLLLAGSALLMDSCRTVPITGRSQFIFSSVSQEQALGLQAYQACKKASPQSQNSLYNSALNRCATALISVADSDTGFEWEFTVLESKEQNALCAPGGKIAVYSGLMDLMNNEAELAFVVAHEIAHAIARHYGERSSWDNIMDIGGMVVSGLSDNPDAVRNVYDIAKKYGIMLPFSRSNEYEADQIGLILMARAGYNPNAAVEFWSRFTEGSQESILSGLMSTHPRDAARIQAMKEILPLAFQEYQQSRNKYGYGMAL